MGEFVVSETQAQNLRTKSLECTGNGNGTLSKIITFPVQDFYRNLDKFPFTPYNPDLEGIGDAFCVCLGGTFRSPEMARYLRQKGVRLADPRAINGFRISDLPSLVSRADISEDGYIYPSGFERPIRNIFIGMDIWDEACLEGSLFPFLLAMEKRSRELGAPINTKVHVVDGDEDIAGQFYSYHRGHDPEIDD